jgi:hypothetical protein
MGKTSKLDDKLQLTESDYVLLNTKSVENTSIVLEFLLIAKEIIQTPPPSDPAKPAEESKASGLTETRDYKKFQFGYCVI